MSVMKNKKHAIFISGICLVLTSVGFNSVKAATLEVGSGYSYTLIQAAINDSTSGVDEVKVHSGTYYENIDFNGKAITVYTTEGAVIDGGQNGRVVNFYSSEGPDSILDGFTITNGLASYGGGIRCEHYCSPTIRNCVITGNTATGEGGGILCYNNSPATIINCTITNNNAREGGGTFCEFSSPMTITDCIITGNTASRQGGGVFSADSSPVVTNCIINGNTSPWGAGVTCAYDSSMTIINSIISGNLANGTSNGGGGVYCWMSSLTITNCTIAGNSTTQYGGGIYFDFSSPMTIVNNIIWGNTASLGVNEIHLVGGAPLDLTYSDIRGGWAGVGNIDADPLFIDQRQASEAPTTAGDYHLTGSSPCIDVANSSGAPYDDIDGESRPRGEGYDMGSDEVYCPDADADGAGCGTSVDCDDTDPDINPGACDIKKNGIDEDCDGQDRKSGHPC